LILALCARVTRTAGVLAIGSSVVGTGGGLALGARATGCKAESSTRETGECTFFNAATFGAAFFVGLTIGGGSGGESGIVIRSSARAASSSSNSGICAMTVRSSSNAATTSVTRTSSSGRLSADESRAALGGGRHERRRAFGVNGARWGDASSCRPYMPTTVRATNVFDERLLDRRGALRLGACRRLH